MDLPDWIDWKRVTEIALVVLFLMQAIKLRIPEMGTWYASLLLALIVSFAAVAYQGGQIVILREILNGLFAWAAAETGYQFLSDSKSGKFTLPAKPNSAPASGTK